MPRRYDEVKFDMAHLRATAERCCNWGRWGPDDEIGTLNFIGADEIRRAAGLVRRGEVFSLALNFDSKGPQNGRWGGRFNPIHTMLATGTDAIAGDQLQRIGEQYADDMITMPLQCGTQWDALSHIFYDGRMWNGYDARLVDSGGARRNGIEKTRNKMFGRGVLLDVARHLGVDALDDGCAIAIDDLEATARRQRVEILRGDFVIVRTGQMERCLRAGDWGHYAGGPAPGLAFETCSWIHRREMAAVCTDTWGCEVNPFETDCVASPWHWVVIPMIGLSMGEIFWLRELAEDCARDGVYEFLFAAPPLPITGAVGSPVNPLAIK
ncbi:MAG: cyclase family protein [Dongiaceae bacterium]